MDYQTLIDAVDFTTTYGVVAAIAGGLAVAYIVIMGAQMTLNMLNGYGFISNRGRYVDGYDTWSAD